MRLVYNVYDDDNQIESKQFDNFPKALEYAKKGLITYICEEDLDCPDCEEVVVWTWDSTWDDEEAINSITQKECVPDEVECEKPLDNNIEINISGPAKEVKNLVELVFDNAFDLDWDAPVEEVKVDVPKCVDEFGLDEEPAIKDLDFDVDSPFEDDLYYSKEEDEDEKDLEIGEPEIIETPEEKFDDSELAMSDEDVEKVNEPFKDNEPNGEETAKDEPETKDEEPKSKDKDNKEDNKEELDELLDLNVSASIDGGDNNDVRVLSSCEQKRGNKKLDELLDANIDLGFSGGTGNNVSVLSPLGEETKDDEKVELTEGTGFFSLFDDAAEQLFLEKWSDILNDHLKNRINLLRLRVKRPSGRNYGTNSNDYITDFRVLKTEVWTYGTEPKLIFKLSAVKLDEKNLRITKPYIEIDLNILLDDLAAVDKATGAVKPKSRIAASKNYDLACHWDYTSIEFTKWTSKPFINLLTQLVEEQKELKQQTDGRNIKVKAAKRLAQFSQEEVNTAKNWFRNHIERIEFNVVSGSPRGISTDDFDIEREQIHTINKIHIENIDDAIEEAILERQKKFLDDYNIKHITPSLDHEGTNIKLGTNIYLNWRRADEEVQNHLPYYITEFFNTCRIYFDTKIGNAPEEVKNILKEAVYGSDRTRNALDDNKYSLQNNLAGEMIINQLFNSDLNFLSDRLAASFNRKSKTAIKNLKEGLNDSEFAEYMQLCKEIGLYGTEDLDNFMKEAGLKPGCPAQDVLQALRDYRAELGPDFKIVNESDKKELNELFGFGKKSKPKNRYLMAMFVDTSRRLYTSDVWQDILKIVEKYVNTTRSRRSYFAADIINQVEFVTTEDVFKRIESEVKIFLNGLHWKRKKYFTGSSDWVSGDGEVNFDIADAAKHLIGFARVQSNIKESLKESLDLPEMRASEIERELDLHGDIYFNLLETVEESDEDGWRCASEIRIEAAGSGYEVYFEWLDQDGDYVCTDKDPEFTYETFEELLREIDGVYVTVVDLDEYFNESLDEAVKMNKDELLDKEGTADVDLINAGRPEEERVELEEGRQPVYSNVIFYCYDQNDEEQTYTKSNMTPIMIRTEVDELVRNGAARVYVEAKIDGEWEALDKYTYDPEWTPGTPEYAARNSKDFALALESLDQEDDLTDQEFAEQFKQRLEEIKK